MRTKPKHNSFIFPSRSNKSFLYIFLALVLCGSPVFGQTFTNQTTALFGGSTVGGFTVSWGDYDQDGYVDLLTGNTVYHNNAGSSFTNTYNSGGGMDGIWGDYDNDGDMDIYSWNGEKIHRYDGGSSFTPISLPPMGGNAYAAVWGDWDNDADLDLFVAGASSGNEINRMVENVGPGFVNRWQAGPNMTRGVTAADFDEDGDLDIYASNYWQNNNFHRNPGTIGTTEWNDGGFGAATNTHTGGADFADYNNDGYFDISWGSVHGAWMGPSSVMKNLGPLGSYHYTLGTVLSTKEGDRAPMSADYDNDGDMDILMTVWSGYGAEARLFRNDGNFSFTDVTTSMGLASGMGGSENMGAAWADVDNDGDMDLLAGNRLWENSSSTNGNHWLKLNLAGDGLSVNKSAIGSKVKINVGGETLIRQISGGAGGGFQNDLAVHFGLGSQSGPVDVQIIWADGTTQMLNGLAVDNTYSRTYGYTPPPVTAQWDGTGNWTNATGLWTGTAEGVPDPPPTNGDSANVRSGQVTFSGGSFTGKNLQMGHDGQATDTTHIPSDAELVISGGAISMTGNADFHAQNNSHVKLSLSGSGALSFTDPTKEFNMLYYGASSDAQYANSRSTISLSDTSTMGVAGVFNFGARNGTPGAGNIFTVDLNNTSVLTLDGGLDPRVVGAASRTLNLNGGTFKIAGNNSAVDSSIWITGLDGSGGTWGASPEWASNGTSYTAWNEGGYTMYQGLEEMATVTFTLRDNGDGTFSVYASTSAGDNVGLSYYNIELENITSASDVAPSGVSPTWVPFGFQGEGLDLPNMTPEAPMWTLFSYQNSALGQILYGIGQTSGTAATAVGPPSEGIPWEALVLLATGTYDTEGPSPAFGSEVLANIFTEEWTTGPIPDGLVELANVVLVYELRIPGDFDLDGDVDGVDFSHWQIGYPMASGSTLDTGDADGDGDTDGVDFGIWQANYPYGVGAGAMAGTPEPATLVVLALASLGMIIRRRR